MKSQFSTINPQKLELKVTNLFAEDQRRVCLEAILNFREFGSRFTCCMLSYLAFNSQKLGINSNRT